MLEPGMEPYPGYRLKRCLGRGGFAEVWQTETPDGTLLALKFVACSDRRSATQEIRSLQAVRQLCHPNLIRIDRVWGYLNFIVIAMELADGSLDDLLEAFKSEFNTALSPEQACEYLSQAAGALDFLNTRQHHIEGKVVAIQHCDVKPSNLLLCGEVVKLADFGLSVVTTSGLQFHRRAGTLDYTAPEVFHGQLSDRTDQYSLAVTYCEVRGGRLPFPGSPKKFERGYVRPLPDLSMLPDEEMPIVARALSPAPHDRWESCSEFVAELAQLLKKDVG
jgi:serine/threonine protein kinase